MDEGRRGSIECYRANDRVRLFVLTTAALLGPSTADNFLYSSATDPPTPYPPTTLLIADGSGVSTDSNDTPADSFNSKIPNINDDRAKAVGAALPSSRSTPTIVRGKSLSKPLWVI